VDALQRVLEQSQEMFQIPAAAQITTGIQKKKTMGMSG